MADDINAALDDLDNSMFSNFEDYEQTLRDTWESFSGNNGQSVIVSDYIMEAVTWHISMAREFWPYGATPADYKDLMYEIFDTEVMQRAFSQTIEQSHDEVYHAWSESMDLQRQHETLLSTIGDSAAPHSTELNWKEG